jgi:MFS family permease
MTQANESAQDHAHAAHTSPAAQDTPGRHMPATASWAAFAAAATILIVAQGSLYLVAAALPLYLHHLGAATAHIGTEVGAGNLAGVACTIAAGPLINRWGPHRLLLAGVACYLVAASAMLALPSEATVTAARALQGVGVALVVPSALTMAPGLLPMGRGAALGTVAALNNLGLAIGPPLGLWLYATGGARALLLPAIACAVVGLGAALALPRAPRSGVPARGFGYDRGWTLALLANALIVAYFGGIIAYLPLVLARLRGPNAGIFFTADAVGVLLLRVPSGALVDRYGPRLPQLVGIALTLAGIGALFLPYSALTLVLAGAGTGVGAGLFITAVLVTLHQRSGDHNRGTAMALMLASFNAGIFGGAAVSGLLIGPGGFASVLLLGLATTIAGLPVVLLDRDGAGATEGR